MSRQAVRILCISHIFTSTTQTNSQLWPHSLGQGDEAHIVLGVGAQLEATDGVDGVLHSGEAVGRVVAVAHELAVVHAAEGY